MAVTGAGAARFATQAERERSCVFAANFDRMTDILRLPNVTYGYASAQPIITSRGMQFASDAGDYVRCVLPEMGRSIKGAATPLSIVAQIETPTFNAAYYQPVIVLDGGLNALSFGLDNTDSATDKKIYVLRQVAVGAILSTATVSAGALRSIGVSINTSGTATFYANGAQVGATAASATGPALHAGNTLTIGNVASLGNAFKGRIKLMRVFRAELSAQEMARYA